MAINDFGEKIGGAKKDLWKQRGLQIEDLVDMNEAEKTVFIKKDNVWAKPDYQALVDSGLSRRVVYFMKKMRDATPIKPVLAYSDNTPELIKIKQEGYISFVRSLRDAVMALKSEEDVKRFYEDYLVKNYITRSPGAYYVTVSENAYGCIDNKLLRAAQVGNFSSIDRDIAKKQFCFSDEEKQRVDEKTFSEQFDVFEFKKDTVTFGTDYAGRTQVTVKLGYGSVFFYPQGEDADVSSWEEGKHFVLRRGRVIAKNIDTHEEANDFVHKLYLASKEQEKNQPDKGKTGRKTRFTPKQLEGIKRDGDDYRHGQAATGEKYMQVFGFKGGEFGNWMSEKDRKASLDFGYDALVDMCKALNISVKDISLGGRLSIAFGSRGSAGAAAHYEPLREVINLTKMHGAGSLAHEWAHAMDDILGKALGLAAKSTHNFMSENTHKPQVPKSMKALVDSMKYKTVLDDEVLAERKVDIENYTEQLRKAVGCLFPKSLTEEQQKKLDSLVDSYINNAKDCAEAFAVCVWDGNGNKDIDALSAFRKEITGRGLPKDQRIYFAHYQNNLRNKMEHKGDAKRIETDFYKNSKRFDNLHSKTDHGYWQSTIEMFARAFACYVNDKIEGKSDYLVGHSECAVSMDVNRRTGEPEIVKAIPDGEERVAINQCFDNFISELKEMDLLHDFEPELAMFPDRKPSLFEQIQSSQVKYDAQFKENEYKQLEFEL